jgi:Putative beta-barrel porin-2, OmpL-like. bbp2
MVNSGLTVWRPRLAAAAASTWLIAFAAAPAVAQESQPAAKQDSATMDFFRHTEVSGFVDTYFSYNFNKPASPCGTAGGVAIFNCLRNFEVAHNSFSLNMAEVALEKRPTTDSRAGFRVDLDFGPTSNIVHGAEPGGTTVFQNIEQAYISFLAPTGTGLQLDFGKFVTMMGNEVIETKDNWNYGRSLLFTLAVPYYHAGARLTYSPNDKFTVQGHFVNGWNNVTDNNTGKSVGGSVTIKPHASLTIIENFMFGPEQNGNNDDWRKVSDTIVTYAATKQLSLAANYDHGWDTVDGAGQMWHGIAGYLKYQANDWFAVSPRVEWYRDRDGFTTGTAQKLTEATITAEFKHKDGVVMRVEYRGDFSDEPFFVKKTSDPVKSQNTLTVGLVYAFSTKAQ